jgi:hypothetical protein
MNRNYTGADQAAPGYYLATEANGLLVFGAGEI